MILRQICKQMESDEIAVENARFGEDLQIAAKDAVLQGDGYVRVSKKLLKKAQSKAPAFPSDSWDANGNCRCPSAKHRDQESGIEIERAGGEFVLKCFTLPDGKLMKTMGATRWNVVFLRWAIYSNNYTYNDKATFADFIGLSIDKNEALATLSLTDEEADAFRDLIDEGKFEELRMFGELIRSTV